MEWELKRKYDEMTELKRTFNETKLLLIDERAKTEALKRENDNLRAKEQKDRGKIEELVGLVQPLEQEIILRKDIRPGKHRSTTSNSFCRCQAEVCAIGYPDEQESQAYWSVWRREGKEGAFCALIS